MKIDVIDLTGKKIEEVTLKKAIFGAKINQPLMTQAVRVFQSNQRKASAKALTRSQIARTTKKVYRQKGTGGARHGSRRAPIYVGGGVAHGPKLEQNWKLDLPKKMKKSALKSALSLLAKDKKIVAIKGLTDIKEPKTKKIMTFLTKLFDKKELRNISLVYSKNMKNAVKSVQNIKFVNTYLATDLTTYQVLNSNKILLSLEGLKDIEERLS
jgi:large subunit ribosomal protein L4